MHAGRNFLKKLHILLIYLEYKKNSFIHLFIHSFFNNDSSNAYYALGTRIEMKQRKTKQS